MKDEGNADIRSVADNRVEHDGAEFVLRLYVAGQAPASVRALANLRQLCEECLKGRYSLEVIDLYQQPERAQADQIVAVPTLIKELPLPLRRIIGDLSSTERVLVGIGIDRC